MLQNKSVNYSYYCSDVTKFEFELEHWHISNNFTAFDIHRMNVKIT